MRIEKSEGHYRSSRREVSGPRRRGCYWVLGAELGGSRCGLPVTVTDVYGLATSLNLGTRQC